MFPWLGLDRLYFLLLRLFLRWVTRATLLPDTTDSLQIDPDKPVVYILKNRSGSDLIVADEAAAKLGLPSFFSSVDIGDTRLKRGYLTVFLRRRARYRRRKASAPRHMTRVVDELTANAELDLQLVPVSVFWGRRPEREKSLWKIFFSDNWSPAGFIKKMFVVIAQGRQLYIQFSPAMSLRPLVDESEDKERIIRKASRILRVHFRLQREAVIGPDLSHRRMLVDSLVRTSSVTAAIQERAEADGISPQKAEAIAKRYAFELAADYSHTTVRFLEVVLTWVWHRIFDGVETYNLNRVRQIANNHEIIYVPCHRSHLDYLLLSYVLFKHGLVPPHIAAGINLNLPVLGTILRRGGAFFMRRSFRDNPLYSAVFNEYMHIVLTRGYSMEYFVEGSRSRSGRVLSPRTGMLAMTVSSFRRDNHYPIALVPVYVGYEKVIESGSYIKEMHGKGKKKESVGGLLSSLKILRQHWGQVHLNFGEPIKLQSYLNTHQPDWKTCKNDEWIRPLVNRLGMDVVARINAAAVVNPINLLSLALLATDKHTIDEQLLRCQLRLYINLLKQAPYSNTMELPETDPDAIIAYAIEHEFAFRIEHLHGDLISTDQGSALQMTYTRNNTLHLFALPGLISSFFLNARRQSKQRVHGLVNLLYPFLRSEYSLHWEPGEELDEAVDTLLDAMQNEGLLEHDGDDLIGAATHTLEAEQLYHLGKTVLQMQERLFLTIRLLVQNGSGEMTTDELKELAQQSAHRLSLLHEFNSPDFFDGAVFKSLVKQLQKHELMQENEDGKLEFDRRITALDEESNHILSAETRLTLQRVVRHSGA